MQKTEAEMLRTKNFGRKSLNEIKEILGNLGSGFGMKIDAQGRLVMPPPRPDRRAGAICGDDAGGCEANETSSSRIQTEARHGPARRRCSAIWSRA